MNQDDDVTEEFDVTLTDGAIEDIERIKSYIEEKLLSPTAAQRTVARIFDAARALCSLPFRNRVLIPLRSGLEIRAARAGHFLLFYLVDQQSVRIFSILHSTSDVQRRLKRLFGELTD